MFIPRLICLMPGGFMMKDKPDPINRYLFFFTIFDMTVYSLIIFQVVIQYDDMVCTWAGGILSLFHNFL